MYVKYIKGRKRATYCAQHVAWRSSCWALVPWQSAAERRTAPRTRACAPRRAPPARGTAGCARARRDAPRLTARWGCPRRRRRSTCAPSRLPAYAHTHYFTFCFLFLIVDLPYTFPELYTRNYEIIFYYNHTASGFCLVFFHKYRKVKQKLFGFYLKGGV